MDRNIRTTVYLDPELKNIIDAEHLNLSQWLNDNLERYFSASSINDIDRELKKIKQSEKVLLAKREALVKSGVAETKDDALAEDVLREIQDTYKKRHEPGVGAGDDYVWITSPKNLKRCKQLGKEPEQMLKQLGKWYCGLQKNQR